MYPYYLRKCGRNGGTHLRDACLISWHRGLALIWGGVGVFIRVCMLIHGNMVSLLSRKNLDYLYPYARNKSTYLTIHWSNIRAKSLAFTPFSVCW